MRCSRRGSWYAPIYVLPLLFAANSYGSDSEAVVLECMARNLPKSSSFQGIEFRSENPYLSEEEVSNKVRILRASVYVQRSSNDQLRVLAYFHEPFDIRGARILLRENETQNDAYLYVPALPGVRRLKASHISSSVHGTDFSYEDLEQLYGMAKSSTITRSQDTEIDGSKVYVLISEDRADEGADSTYQKVIVYIDQKTCVTVKSEMFAAGNRLRKVFSVVPGSIRQVQGLWVPHEMLMKDLRNKTETKLIVHSIEIDSPLPEEMFDKDHLSEFQP
jgi:hypothetical protein